MKRTGVKQSSQVKPVRIGIYSGTFDPVHTGHIAFALQAVKEAGLDTLYLMPERHPRNKHHVTHYAHRVAMIRRATRPYVKIKVLESEDKQFTVARTLPRLQKRFAAAQLVFLCGSDVLRTMSDWSHIETLLVETELCVGRRHSETKASVTQQIALLPGAPKRTWIIESHAGAVSSSQIRDAMRHNTGIHGLLQSVREYATQEWLYL